MPADGIMKEGSSLNTEFSKSLHIPYLLPGQVLLVCALMVPPSKVQRKDLYTIALPLIWGFDSYYYFSLRGSLGLVASLSSLQALSLLFFRNPRETYVRIGSSNAFLDCTEDLKNLEDANNQRYPLDLITRIRWILSLIYFPSGDSYDSRPANIKIKGSRNDPQWRKKCVIQKALELLFCILAFDAVNTFVPRDPFFSNLTVNIDTPLPSVVPRWIRNVMSPRSFRILLIGTNTYIGLNVGLVVYGLFTALLGGLGIISEAWGGQDNSTLSFGTPMTIASGGLSGFWGKFWHQQIRNMINDPGKHLMKQLGFPRSSPLARIVETSGAFFFSGLLHAPLVPFHRPYSRHLRVAFFFNIQTVGIILEGKVGRLFEEWFPAKDRGPLIKALAVCTRLIWVWYWFYMTVPSFARELRALGFWDVKPLPTSIWKLG
jgi:hypothetical protein